MAKNTTANIAQTFVMKRAVNPRGESTCTAAWNSTAQTSQYVRNNEKRYGWFGCNDNFISKPLGESHSNKNIMNAAAWIATMPTYMFIVFDKNEGEGRKFVLFFFFFVSKVISISNMENKCKHKVSFTSCAKYVV